MADLKQLEFYVLRYVPHLAREEFINIGVLLFELRDIGFGFSDVRMTNDWRRVYCLDRQVDIEVLQRLGADLRMHLQHPQDMAMLPRKLEDSFANLIQISARKVCLAADPVREMARLSSIYLEAPQLESLPGTVHPKSEHATILAGIEHALVRAGIWDLRIKNIKAVEYTKKNGDRLVFDFGYVVGPEVRFFQAVPLRTNTNQALILAHRFPAIAACILAQTRESATLTAVIADDLDRRNLDIEFALDAFKDNKVSVVTVAEMQPIADKTRQDLNAVGR